MASDQDIVDSNGDVIDVPMHEAAATWQLAVLGGLHAGALVDVAADDWTLVGSAEDCDIVLRDARVLPHHAALFVRGGQLQLRAIDGELLAQGQSQAPGNSVALGDAQTWQMAGVTLGVGCRGSAPWEALRASPTFDAIAADTEAAASEDADGADADSTFAADADADAGETPAPDVGPKTPLRLRVTRKAQHVMAAAAACAVVVATGAVAWGVVWPKVQARENSSAIAGILGSLGMPELRVVEASSGHLRIEGVVRSESDRAKLMQALQQRGIYPAVDIVNGEQLAGTVQNSFRQRGMVVKAQYVGGGRVEVQGAAPSAVTEQVVQDVLAATNAVTQVALLDAAASAAAEPQETVLAAAAPAPAPAPAANNKSGNDPQRIVGVVGGATPFLLTQDRKRYLVGSMLPDGTQIDQIDGHTVVFSRQGKPMLVQF
jgi:type III secretion system YscD/HrpQ family protein